MPAAAEPVVSTPAVAVDLPWEEAPVANVTAATEPSPPIQVAPVSIPAEVPSPALVEAAVAVADDDDEPPAGEYDYYETDAEAYDYSFADDQEQVQAEPEPLPAAQPATGLAAEWLELFPRLGLSGMTGSIGANCSLIEAEGDNWLLHLDPGQSALFNATQQRRLNDALNQALGRTLNLRIEVIKPEQETPAQAAARKRAERQRLAEESIANDPVVRHLIEHFGASVRADSIEPLERV